MEYPWHHHHPPPSLYPPPLQPPPPPFSQSHNFNNNNNNNPPQLLNQFHHIDSQSHTNQIPPPSFESLHHHHPTFQSHPLNPISQFHNHNPPPPSFQLLPDQHPPSSQLHPLNPNFQLHAPNPPSFQLSHNQHPPSFRLHDHHRNPASSQLHPLNPNFQHHPPNPPSFQSSHVQDPSFQLHHHNPPGFQSHIQDHPRFDLLDKNPSFRSPAPFSLHKPPQIANDAYSPFDHGCKRPRPDELGINERTLKLKMLVHDHGGNDSVILPNGKVRGSSHEDLPLKRPRFQESDVRNKYPVSNLDTRNKTNEFQDTGFAELLNKKGPSLETSFRSSFDHKQGRNDLYPPNHDIRSNKDTILPTSLQVSPQNRTISEKKPVFTDPKGPLFSDKLAPSLQKKPSLQEKPSSLFPISADVAAPSSHSPFSETQNSVQPNFQEKPRILASNGFPAKECQPIGHRLSTYNKPKALDASRIFKQPHRATRPDHIVVILRGLPGSGKSYLAKMMRDLEAENGGIAPRIHSMDDYFMTEVEKVEESGSLRGKKPVVKMVMEYCYEAEMEEAYRSSMLKTFKKTLNEGAFPFVIVDDRNLRVADFAQFWAIAKRSGYEVYLLEATYKDPAGCAARNVHDFTLEDIQKMADQWEEAPSMYLKLDAKSLLQGDDLKENTIQEVDMDTDDGESEDAQNGLAERYSNILAPAVETFLPSGRSKVVDSLNAESDHSREEVKELGRSKWSNDLEDDDGEKTKISKGDNANALSAIVESYKKEGKSVHWGDKAADTGFSIGAAKRVNTTLEIGPGSGYNSKSNPLPEELGSPGINEKSSMFQERIQAERESTRAVFDRRRNRIGGLDLDEE